jgi:hypothetical protein
MSIFPKDGAENPDKAMGSLLTVLGSVATGAIAISSLLSIAQVNVFGTGLNLSPLARIVESIISPSLFTGIAVGAILGASFKTPLVYWANKEFRPAIPSENMLLAMYRRNLISQLDYQRYMSYYGYSDKWINNIVKASYTLPSPRDAFIMLKKGLITETEYYNIMLAHGFDYSMANNLTKHYHYDEGLNELLRASDIIELPKDFVEAKLRNMGMDEKSLAIWTELIYKRPLRDEASNIASALRSLFVDGYIQEDEYRSALQQLGYSVESIDMRIKASQLMYDRNLVKLAVSKYIYQFRKDMITAEEFEQALLNLKVDKAVAVAIVNLELARRGMPELEE